MHFGQGNDFLPSISVRASRNFVSTLSVSVYKSVRETSRLKALYSLSFESKIDSTTESCSPILTNTKSPVDFPYVIQRSPLYVVFSLLSQEIFWNNKIVSNFTHMFFIKRSQHDTAYWSRVRIKSSS